MSVTARRPAPAVLRTVRADIYSPNRLPCPGVRSPNPMH